MSAPDAILLEAVDAACHFDVSAPLITRIVERRPRRILKAVDGVSFQVRRGRTFSVVGESGCGKSTLARLVVGLERPTSGSIRLHDVPDAEGRPRRPRLQMIFQDPYASLNPRWRVEDIVAEPLVELGLVTGAAAISARVRALLGLVGLAASDAAKFPHEFSGGQRQRISIARALATEADLLVCDEPTSALDVSVQAQVLNLMRQLQAELGLTYLFISHNLSVVRHLSDDIAVMYLGRFVESGPADTVFSSPRHPYSRLLIETVPDVEAPNRDRAPMAGEVPNPIDRPAGCAFASRCPQVEPACRLAPPPLVAVDADTRVACRLVPARADAAGPVAAMVP
ncbi:ABC transporter ATP-binding protein [Prosthecomicrobium hirschii]|uniref:ABC transporter ATP-binding protein n=1 Tax=Prosthecodimorpha hirschii TaxID=665126 RepID=UPI00112BA5F3|nr:oligopeptide/dipeptide ABC transporter ATP-binding protein [Prosthecomicrobium hirschii]TPQ52049.1 ABC transporter ATP-binding protein [Prosthecomicrobium hirschii]